MEDLELDILNKFLIKIAESKVGIRKKIVTIEKFLKELKNEKEHN